MSFRQLTIEKLGGRGEGVAPGPDGPIFIPYGLASETVLAEVEGRRGTLLEVLTASEARIAPFCRNFSRCGGCAVQTLRWDLYVQWKRDLVTSALRRAKLSPPVLELADAHGAGRRRATFHARHQAGRVKVGFSRARSHDIIEMEDCPVLAPSLATALPAARALASVLVEASKPLDILATATACGLDIDLRGHGPLSELETQKLIEAAVEHDIARLSNHGMNVVTRRAPLLAMGRAMLIPPPGAFLQATMAAEELLAAKVRAHAGGADPIADLFSGVGTFALRLAADARVDAFDISKDALGALARAARKAQLRAKVFERDLFVRPLCPAELVPYRAAVFDPPRVGAVAQAKALAASRVPRIVAVSCNPETFARDAAILSAGGYHFDFVEPIDQFRATPHVEIVALFRRDEKQPRRARRLLS
ncbi:MAG TPA: RNA methyltransferase [Methylocella sp.]|nr:RNA methyltransferase [Methylocella sp.]